MSGAKCQSTTGAGVNYTLADGDRLSLLLAARNSGGLRMKKNIHKLERIISLAAGSALAAYGFTPKVDRKRFTLPSILTTIAGAGLTTYGLLFQKKRVVNTRNVLLGVLGSALVVRGITGRSFIYKGLGVSTRGKQLVGGVDSDHIAKNRKGKKVEHRILVNAPVDQVYRLWSNFENFPRWMNNVESVNYTGADRTHWKVKSNTGIPVEFDARIKTNIPNEVISWESVSGDLPNAGAVRFKNVNGSTRVEVTMEVNPPGGVIGDALANFFRDPERQLQEDLNNFKRVAENETTIGITGTTNITPTTSTTGTTGTTSTTAKGKTAT
jgi:uncharacterized membrane protein